jgi:hypothetical protein
MIQHILVLKWKAGTTAAQVDHAFAQAEALVDEIDGVQRITLGRNPGESNNGFTHAFVVNLADEDALARYLSHPLRRRYVAEALDPIEESRIEIDVPDGDQHRHGRGTEASWEWGPTRHSASADAAALRWEEQHREP